MGYLFNFIKALLIADLQKATTETEELIKKIAWKQRFNFLILVFLILVATVFAVILIQDFMSWSIVSVQTTINILFAFYASIAVYFLMQGAQKSKWLEEKVPDGWMRTLVIFILIPACFISFLNGRMSADSLYSGRAYQSIADGSCSRRYIGIGGNYMFFFDPVTKGVRYELAEDVGELTLYKKRRKSCDEKKGT